MTGGPAAGTAAGEIVPLAERLRYLRILRVLVAVVVALAALVTHEKFVVSLASLAEWTGAYLAASLVLEVLWRSLRARNLTLFGATMILDGVYLAWLSHAAGNGSPLTYFVLIHVTTVCLLASHRTGVKLAVWHSMMAFIVHYAVQAGVVLHGATGPSAQAASMHRLTLLVVLIWVVALSTATFSAVNERELRRRRVDLEAFAAMAAELENVHETDRVAEIALGHVAAAFDFPRGVLLHRAGDDLVVLARHGDVVPRAHGGPDQVVREAWDTGRTILRTHAGPEGDPFIASLLPGAANLAVAPMFADGVPAGAVVVEHRIRRASRVEQRVVSMVEQFVAHAALALHTASLFARVQEMADTDGLTQVANRRRFDDHLAREAARAARSHDPLALVLLDIDHFKDVNDSHGHQAGDEVLREVAGVLVAECREFDLVARYGGEEFAIVLPRCTLAEAAAVSERLRLAVAAIREPLPVTVSIGVAVLPDHATSAGALVDAADHALYSSKRAGRDRVTAAGIGTAGRQPEPVERTR